MRSLLFPATCDARLHPADLPPLLVLEPQSDLVEYGSENAVKAAGKYRQQGKTYEVVDGDICFWSASRLSLTQLTRVTDAGFLPSLQSAASKAAPDRLLSLLGCSP